MSPSEQNEAEARLDALQRSLEAEREREHAEHARVNDAFLLRTSPRALSTTAASAIGLLVAVVFGLVALGTRNPWWALPGGVLGLFAIGGFVFAGRRSR